MIAALTKSVRDIARTMLEKANKEKAIGIEGPEKSIIGTLRELQAQIQVFGKGLTDLVLESQVGECQC
jgi:hypothetical protein